MRVIARSTLNSFVRNRVEPKQQRAVQGHLDTWYEAAALADWSNSAELKAQFRSASIISAERVVFNIKGNEYRLVVAIDFESQHLLIKWVGSHKEYDRIEVGKVKYDKARYTGPTHS